MLQHLKAKSEIHDILYGKVDSRDMLPLCDKLAKRERMVWIESLLAGAVLALLLAAVIAGIIIYVSTPAPVPTIDTDSAILDHSKIPG